MIEIPKSNRGGKDSMKAGYSLPGLVIPLAFLIAMPISANSGVTQELSTFALDSKTCSFGTELDQAFDKFAKKYAAEMEQAGYKFRVPDAEYQENFERLEPIDFEFRGLRISAISIDFETRSIYFTDDFETARQKLSQIGIKFPDGMWAPDEGGGIAENAYLTMPEVDAVWNEVTKRTEQRFSEYGKSLLSCSVPEFTRMANKRNMSVEDFARIEPNPKLWDAEVQRLHEQGTALQSQGEFFQAAQRSSQVLDRLDQSGGSDTIEYVLALDSHARNLSGTGRNREARTLLKRALDLSSELLGAKHLQTTKILVHYSSVSSALGDSEEAWWQLHTSYFQYLDLFGEEHPDTVNALDQLGIATANMVREGKDQMLDMEEAQRQLSNAFVANRKLFGEDDPRTLTSMFNLALVMEASGYPKIAEEGYREVGLKQIKVLGGGHPDVTETTSRLAGIRMRQPETLASAHGLTELVVDNIRERRGNMLTRPADDAHRQRESRLSRRYFLQHADSAWLDRNTDPNKRRSQALEALQDAMVGNTDRAVAMMAARKVILRNDESLGNMITRRQRLSDEWQDNEKGLTLALTETGEAASTRRTVIRKRQLQIESQIDKIDAKLKSGAPEYFDFIQPHALTLKDTQTLLKEDEAILLVVPGSDGTHVFAIAKDDADWIRSDWNDTKINGAVRRLLWDVGANVEVSASESADWSEEGEGAYPFDRKTAFNLYQKIVAPVSGILDGKRHLFVSTSGSLTGLPFGLLVTEPPAGKDGNPLDLRATKWFADAQALVTIPSLQSLRFLRSYRKRKDDQEHDSRFLGFGDPVLSGQSEFRGGGGLRRNRIKTRGVSSVFGGGVTSSGSGVVDLEALKKLSRLPGTATEIVALSNAFGEDNSDVYLGEDSTETKIRQIDLHLVGVLAVATHGLLAGELSGNS